MCLVFVRGIHEHETCDALRVIRYEDADIEPAAGGPHEHQSSVDSSSLAMRRAVRGDGPGSL